MGAGSKLKLRDVFCTFFGDEFALAIFGWLKLRSNRGLGSTLAVTNKKTSLLIIDST